MHIYKFVYAISAEKDIDIILVREIERKIDFSIFPNPAKTSANYNIEILVRLIYL